MGSRCHPRARHFSVWKIGHRTRLYTTTLGLRRRATRVTILPSLNAVSIRSGSRCLRNRRRWVWRRGDLVRSSSERCSYRATMTLSCRVQVPIETVHGVAEGWLVHRLEDILDPTTYEELPLDAFLLRKGHTFLNEAPLRFYWSMERDTYALLIILLYILCHQEVFPC